MAYPPLGEVDLAPLVWLLGNDVSFDPMLSAENKKSESQERNTIMIINDVWNVEKNAIQQKQQQQHPPQYTHPHNIHTTTYQRSLKA